LSAASEFLEPEGFADPVAILFATTFLTIVAALAGFLPAWRASSSGPDGRAEIRENHGPFGVTTNDENNPRPDLAESTTCGLLS
jgi:hypothetical protein